MYLNLKIHRTTALALAGLVLLLVAALFIVPTVAAASCFTDTAGHWAESFICWMKDKGITSGYPDGTFRPNNTITRAEVAVFMQKIITSGDVHINVGPGQWMANAMQSGHSVRIFSNVDQLLSTETGLKYFQLSPFVPTTLLGQSMALKGVELCYNATQGASITNVSLRQYAGGHEPTMLTEIVDETVRTDAGCRTYNLPSQSVLWGSDHVLIIIGVTFTTTDTWVTIGATTFILTPVTSFGVLDQDRLELGLPLVPVMGDAP